MMKKVILLIALYGCSTAPANDWSNWEHCGLSRAEEDWRICHRDLDGLEKHEKGFCYISLECRQRKTIFGNVKKEERSVPLFCPWPENNDISCLRKYRINEKILVTP